MSDRRRRDQQIDPKPLFNLDAERFIVGICLCNDSVFYEYCNTLKPEHFTNPRCARIWAAMMRCMDARKPIRKEWIPAMIRNDSGEDTPLPVALQVMINDAPPASEAELWANAVLGHAGQRSMVDALQKALNEVRSLDIGVGVESMRDVAMRHISTADAGEADEHMLEYHEWGTQVWHDSARALEQDDEQAAFGLSPGLSKVEEVIGRLLPGKLYVLAGMSGSGKSALARQIMEAAVIDAAKRGLGPGYVASLEMTGKEYAVRALAERLNIPAFEIEQGSVNQGRVHAIGNALTWMKTVPLIIDSKPRVGMEEIRTRAMKAKMKHGGKLSIIAVDHVLLIKGGKNESLPDRVSQATIEAKNLAKEFDVPVIMLAQVDEKKLLESSTKRPNTSNLFGGQTINQNADAVLFVHRDSVVIGKFEPPMTQAGKEGELTPWQKWNDRMERARGQAIIYNNKRRGGAGNVSRDLIFRPDVMTFSDP